EPELLVLPHELPQLGNDVKFRHAAQKFLTRRRNGAEKILRCAVAPLREKNSVHFLIVLWITLPLGIRLPEGVSRSGAALEWVPTHRTLQQPDRRQHQKENHEQDDAAGDV